MKDSFDRFLLMNMGPVNVISRFAPDTAMWEVVDDVTIRFNLGKPQPLFLSAMSSSYGPMIVNTAYVEENKTEEDPWAHEFYLTGPAGTGTGPYQITKNEVNEEVVLEKYEAYYRGWENPHFDRLVVRIVPEMATRRQLIENGEADATVQNLSAEDFTALAENPDIQVISGNSTAVYWTTMNAPRLGTVEARQGLCWAFPYEEVVQGVYQGRVIRTGPLATTNSRVRPGCLPLYDRPGQGQGTDRSRRSSRGNYVRVHGQCRLRGRAISGRVVPRQPQ